MADIKFKGFVEPHTGRGPWTIVEPHRREIDGSWVTEAKTYHRVWLPQDAPEPAEGARVEVTGRQKTQKYTKDGDTKYSLIVNADTLTVLSSGNSASTAPVDDPNLPF